MQHRILTSLFNQPKRVLLVSRQCLQLRPAISSSPARSCATNSASSDHSSGSALVDSVNHALERYPVTTALVYLYHNTAYVSALYVLLLAAGIDGPRELGLSLVVNRLTQRLRMPLIFAAAAALVRAVPAFGRLHLSKLMMAPFADLRRMAGPEPVLWDPKQPGSQATSGTTALPPSSAAASPDAAAASEASGVTRIAARGVLAAVNAINMGGVLDKFGLAYVLCGRAIASTQLVAVAYAIRAGVDVDAALAALAAAADESVWQPMAGILQQHAPAAHDWLAPHFSSASNSSGSGSAASAASAVADAASAADIMDGTTVSDLATGADGRQAAEAADATAASVGTEDVARGASSATDVARGASSAMDVARGASSATDAANASADTVDAAQAAAGSGSGSGILSAAAGWMSRWALGCLIINASYPLVLRYGVAGVAEWIGPRATALQNKLQAAEEAAKAAEEKAAEDAGLTKKR